MKQSKINKLLLVNQRKNIYLQDIEQETQALFSKTIHN